jgi:hypothetical protein
MGIIRVDFDATGQLLIIYFAFIKYVRKEWEYNEAMQQLFIDFKEAYDSVRREVLYNIFIKEFGISMKLLRLIQMCLNETFSRFRVGKHLSDGFSIRNDLKQGDALSPLLFNFIVEHATKRVQINQDGLKLNDAHQPLFYVGPKLTYCKEKHRNFVSW